MPDALLDDDLEPLLDDDDGALPPRPRRRRVTPVTGALAAVLVATGGFIAGVQVQKGQQTSGSGGAFPGGGPANLRASAAGGAQDAAPTFGSVANKKGDTLYVTAADGTTVRVRTNAQSKITRNAAASVRGIFPGDSVVVQGTKDRNGDVVATQINATSRSAAASGAGGGFGRGFGAGGGAAPGAAASSGGG